MAVKPEEYDVLVLGSGGGGKFMAWSFAKKGQKVAAIEQKYIGGSCPNVACLPSKNIIHSAKVASLFFRSPEFGITKDNTKINMQVIRDRKRQMVNGLIDLHIDLFHKSGAELICGAGKFIGPKTIQVTDKDGKTRVLTSKKVVINTGSRAAIEHISGLVEAKPLTHVEALELDHIPEHLIVLGGGYVGLELAQAMRRFGSRVTILDRNDRLAHKEDKDVSEALQKLFTDEGIEFITNAHIEKVEGVSGQHVKVHMTKGQTPQIIEGSDLLVATGRISNTQGIGLELTGVELNRAGDIKVNDKLETTAANIWAVGDCAGSPHFTHIAINDFQIAFENMNGGKRVTEGRQVPYCLFIDPELARVGLNETEAKAKKIPYRIVKMPMSMVLRTRTLSETRGFIKVLIDAKSDRILGVTVFGYGAGEIMGAVQIAMLGGLPYTALRDAIFAHPTLVEGLNHLFSEAPSHP